jgi:hypothetical protein
MLLTPHGAQGSRERRHFGMPKLTTMFLHMRHGPADNGRPLFSELRAPLTTLDGDPTAADDFLCWSKDKRMTTMMLGGSSALCAAQGGKPRASYSR